MIPVAARPMISFWIERCPRRASSPARRGCSARPGTRRHSRSRRGPGSRRSRIDRRLRRVLLRDRGLERVRSALVLERPARNTSRREASRSTIISAISSWTSWKRASGSRTACAPSSTRPTLHAALADPDAAGGDAVAAVVERRHRDLEPVPDLTEHRVVGDLDFVKRQLGRIGRAQPELAVDLLGGEAGAVGRNEETGQAAMFLRRVGLGEDQRDPELLPSEINILWRRSSSRRSCALRASEPRRQRATRCRAP